MYNELQETMNIILRNSVCALFKTIKQEIQETFGFTDEEIDDKTNTAMEETAVMLLLEIVDENKLDELFPDELLDNFNTTMP